LFGTRGSQVQILPLRPSNNRYLEARRPPDRPLPHLKPHPKRTDCDDATVPRSLARACAHKTPPNGCSAAGLQMFKHLGRRPSKHTHGGSAARERAYDIHLKRRIRAAPFERKKQSGQLGRCAGLLRGSHYRAKAISGRLPRYGGSDLSEFGSGPVFKPCRPRRTAERAAACQSRRRRR
jgi:hypothetical protein